MTEKYDAVYARQSIDRKDSISIESQIEFCRYELKGGEYKEYKDKGYSGKNTDRPQFQQMIKDIKAGKIRKVLVYKLDRISRSILDFAEMMDLFKRYEVEFVSSTEKFDTSTPMGRAMLNICIVFAQLERETIQKRVADAFYSRSLKGFRMGAVPFGFHLMPVTLNGIHVKMLEPDEEVAPHIRTMFEMYAQPQVSYGDIIRYFEERNILFYGERIKHSTIKRILRNPSYAVADRDLYEFFKSQGTELVNELQDFNGVTSCYLHKKQEAPNWNGPLDNFRLVIAPHIGLIPSELFITCCKKVLANKSYQSARKVCRTWLAGKIKCGSCHRAFAVSKNVHKGMEKKYFRCSLRMDNKNCCKGAGTLRVEKTEEFIAEEMKRKLAEFKTLQKRRRNTPENPKLTALTAELNAVEKEIGTLIDTLTEANPVLIGYVNEKIELLDARRKAINSEIAEVSAKSTPPEQVEQLTDYLYKWDEVSFDDKRIVLDKLIDVIYATSEQIEIKWKI